MLNPPKLIGHRGVKNLSPENTLESIKLAHELGFKWVEIDVKVSKDLVPILLHDDTLDRTTNGTGIPIEINYIDLRKHFKIPKKHYRTYSIPYKYLQMHNNEFSI